MYRVMVFLLTLINNAPAATKYVSTNTGGVTISAALGNAMTFTGGRVRTAFPNTKAITTGAGNDTVTLSGAMLGTGGSVDAGDGTDTLVMAANAARQVLVF